jgi:hypothetical protein
MVELELLAAGLVVQAHDDQGRLNLRLTDIGVQALAASLQRNRRAFDAHEALVGRIAAEMQRAGRLVWRGLSLRAPLQVDGTGDADGPALATVDGPAGASPPAPADLLAQAWPDGTAPLMPEPAYPPHRWAMAMPDVFSIRLTSVEDYVEPAVHEIKVSRADLQSDLRKPDKRNAYLAMAGQCWYVLAAGIADTDEIPPEFGVIHAHTDHLELGRPAPRRAMRLSFGHWMALARATPLPWPEDEVQARLGNLDP